MGEPNEICQKQSCKNLPPQLSETASNCFLLKMLGKEIISIGRENNHSPKRRKFGSVDRFPKVTVVDVDRLQLDIVCSNGGACNCKAKKGVPKKILIFKNSKSSETEVLFFTDVHALFYSSKSELDPMQYIHDCCNNEMTT